MSYQSIYYGQILFMHTIHSHWLQQELQKCFKDLCGLHVIPETMQFLFSVSLWPAYYLIYSIIWIYFLSHLHLFMHTFIFLPIYPHTSTPPPISQILHSCIYSCIHPHVHLRIHTSIPSVFISTRYMPGHAYWE